MSIDIFERRIMAQSLREMLSARTFLKDTFFKNRTTFDTKYVDVDVEKGHRRLAPFVNLNAASPIVDRTGFTTYTYEPPTISPKRETNANDMLSRMPGEDVYGDTMSPEERAAQIAGQDLADLEREITRREEWMIAQALFQAEIPIVGVGVDTTIEFPRSAANDVGLLGAAARWDQSTADITKNLRDWNRIIVKATGLGADIAVMGTDAADELLDNSALKTTLDTRRIDMGLIKPELLPNGVTFLGRLRGTAIDLYSYEEWYYDGSTEQPMVPAKEILVGSTQARTDLRYAAVPVADPSTGLVTWVRGERVPDSWIEKEPPQRFLKVSARPLPIPVQIDAFVVATVLA